LWPRHEESFGFSSGIICRIVQTPFLFLLRCAGLHLFIPLIPRRPFLFLQQVVHTPPSSRVSDRGASSPSCFFCLAAGRDHGAPVSDPAFGGASQIYSSSIGFFFVSPRNTFLLGSFIFCLPMCLLYYGPLRLLGVRRVFFLTPIDPSVLELF